MTPLSDNAQVNAILRQLTTGLQSALRGNLVGVYLYGSLIAGDFDASVSDIDLVVVLSEPLDASQFAVCHQLHESVVQRRPCWHDRLELAYISAHGLRHFRSHRSAMGIISPGEAFHIIQSGADWLISWYALRAEGVALLGSTDRDVA